MPLRLRSAGGGSVRLSSPVALSTDVSMEVPAYDGAKLLTTKTPGAVLQVVSASSTTDTTFTNTTPAIIVGATITPMFASSKILISYNINSIWKSGSWATGSEPEWTLFKNGSSWMVVDGITGYTNNGEFQSSGSIAGTYLDAPNSTSAITYATYVRVMSSGQTGRYNTEGGISSVTLMEIAA